MRRRPEKAVQPDWNVTHLRDFLLERLPHLLVALHAQTLSHLLPLPPHFSLESCESVLLLPQFVEFARHESEEGLCAFCAEWVVEGGLAGEQAVESR